MAVKTTSVKSRMIGDAREAVEDAAGSNRILSKTEAKKLPEELGKAVAKAREESARVTVDAVVDAYASQVSKTLSAVDKTGKGFLSDAEAAKIFDPALRKKALDVRAELAGAPSGGSTQKPTSAKVLQDLSGAVAGLGQWHESGDNGVDTAVTALTGQKSLSNALAAVLPGAGFSNGETQLVLGTPTGSAAIEAFLADARGTLEAWALDHEIETDPIAGFEDAVRSQFGALSSVRVATGADMGGAYLLGKAKDCYVAVVIQNYSDG
jgi:hypothetical protein